MAARVAAQGTDARVAQGLEAQVVASKPFSAKPGTILSTNFRVVSTLDAAEEVIASLRLPPGWQAVIAPGTFTLAPHATAPRLVAISIARNATAGKYEVSFTVTSRRDPNRTATATLPVTIEAVVKAEMVVEDKPETILTGRAYPVKLRLANLGNTELRLAIEANWTRETPVTVTPAELVIPPNDSAPFVLNIKTAEGSNLRGRSFMSVKAKRVGDDAKALPLVAITLDLNIISRSTNKVDLNHRLPVDWTTQVEEGAGGLFAQTQLTGDGSLDEAGKRHLAFSLQGPGSPGSTLLGQVGEYRANYDSGGLEVAVGDQGYGTSRLTDNFRYGRGIGLRYLPKGRSSWGAYFEEDRFGSPASHQEGAYVRRPLGSHMTWQANLLRRTGPGPTDATETQDQLWSLGADINPGRDLHIYSEFGRSHSEGLTEGAADDTAYLVEAEGKRGKHLSYSFSRTHAGPDYRGAYQDADYTGGWVSYSLGTAGGLSAGYQTVEQNLDLRPSRLEARREQVGRLALTLRPRPHWHASLEVYRSQGSDALLPATSAYRDQAMQVALSRTSRALDWSFGLRDGTSVSTGSGERGRLRHYDISVAWRANTRATVSWYAGFGSDSSSSRLLSAGNDMGFDVRWQPSPTVSVGLGYTKYDYTSSERAGSNQLQFSASRRLVSGRCWGLQARRNNGSGIGGPETIVLMSYSVPLAVPVSKKTTIGGIQGRVFDAQKPGHPGIPDAVIIIGGEAVVSDKAGRFVFAQLAPGAHTISLDRRSVGLNRVAAVPMPLEVKVRQGALTEVKIGIEDAACVTGRLEMSGTAGAAGQGGEKFVSGGPVGGAQEPVQRSLGNVLVELTEVSGAEGPQVLRRLTSLRGEFLFEGLRPGKWHLKVYEDDIPEYHYVDKPEQDLELKPGENRQLAVKILPRMRKIKMIPSGGK